MQEVSKQTWRKIIIAVLAGIAIFALLFASDQISSIYNSTKQVLSPFFTGAIVAFIFNVPVRAIERRLKFIKRDKLRRGTAIAITLIIILAILSLLVFLLSNQIVKELDKLQDKNIIDTAKLKELILKLTKLEDFSVSQIVNQLITKLGDSFESAISNTGSILTGAVSAVSAISRVAVNLVLGFVFAIYCLFQKETLVRQGRKILYAFLDEEKADYIVRFVRLTSITFTRFLSGQCIEVCILGVLFAIAMAIFRMPYILLISFVVAVSAFIPVVGSLIGCAFGCILIGLDGNFTQVIIYIVMSIVIQQFEGNIIYPRVVGDSIGLSGMWVLVAVAVGGALMGAGGMILMVPVAAVIQTLLREATYKRLGEKNISEEKLKRKTSDPIPENDLPVRKKFKKEKKAKK